MIYEHLRYALKTRNFLYMIRYVLYDTYRVSYDSDNNGHKTHTFLLF